MFCSSCGTQVPDDSIRCTNCGAAMRGGSAAAGSQSGGAVKGFFILVASYFLMPLKTLKIVRDQLREIGSKGMLDVSTELPHLNWVRVAGGVIACLAIIVALLGGLFKGISAYQENSYDTGNAIMQFLVYLVIVGPLCAVAFNWFIMYMVELITIWVSINNNIKRMADRR
ncbi:MAG TPA: zinc ribbon domain-containing protein [Steroidobacteraceae bacterium]|nr:zinc ribbon domain-containing protein [Steroidobacteraceae bacterium]